MTTTIELTAPPETLDSCVSGGGNVSRNRTHDDGNGCPHCHARPYTESTWCRSCGYYALIGKCVEIADWEKEQTQGHAQTQGDASSASVLCGVPLWAWQLAATLIGIVAASLFAYLRLPAGSPERSAWTLGQAGGGFLLCIASYALVARAALRHNQGLSAADVIFSPLRIWLEAIHRFPESFPQLWFGVAGFWASLVAHVLLGVPYNELLRFSNDPTPPAKSKPAITSPARSGGGNMTMEESLNEFADKAGADQLAQAGTLQPADRQDVADPDQALASETLDCLIVGYVPEDTSLATVGSLVVAIREKDEWRVIGAVSTGLTPEMKAAFLASARSARRDQPIVRCQYDAVWLLPDFHCRVQARRVPGTDRFQDLEFQGLK